VTVAEAAGNVTYHGLSGHFSQLVAIHIGVDSWTKLIHSMTTTAANVHDAKVLPELRSSDLLRSQTDSGLDCLNSRGMTYSMMFRIIRGVARDRRAASRSFQTFLKREPLFCTVLCTAPYLAVAGWRAAIG
jgi:IS5 family transposase